MSPKHHKSLKSVSPLAYNSPQGKHSFKEQRVDDTTKKTPRGLVWTGRVLSILPIPLLIMSFTAKLMQNDQAVKGLVEQYGYPRGAVVPIGIAELACTILYLIPNTAVLGAILITGYLGGATATHVRAGELGNAAIPVIMGVVLWLGLLLRDRRLWSLLPFRCMKKAV
jgi:hypothetical protein